VTLAANFFKISLNFDVAFGMERTRRDVTQVQGMQQLTDCPLMVSNLVFRFDPPLNIHTAPTDKTIFLCSGSGAFNTCAFTAACCSAVSRFFG
jgi:hypothetical protein